MKQLTFGFIIFFFFLLSFSSTNAQEATLSATPTITPAVVYDLAYPGLLPDHPLYFFKVIRDKVVSSLINDPVKRAEFNLLTSDKRFNAAISLVEKKKYEKALDTLSKSNNYLHDSIVSLEKAKSMDRDIVSLKDKEGTAVDKRLEITEGLLTGIPQDHQNTLKQEVARIKKLDDRLNAL